ETWRGDVGQRTRDAVVEAIPEILRVRRPRAIVGHQGPLIADLETVRAGDVRDVASPRVRSRAVVAKVLRAIDDARTIAILGAARRVGRGDRGRALFADLDQI